MPEPIVVPVVAPVVAPAGDGKPPVAPTPTTPPAVTPPEEQKVPLSRLNEALDKVKEFEDYKKKHPETPTTPKEETEEERLAKDFVFKTIEEREKTQKAEQAAVEAELNQKVAFYKSIEPTLDEKVLYDLVDKYDLDFSESSDGKTIHPIDKAYKIFKDMTVREQEAAKKAVEGLKGKPNNPNPVRSDGASAPLTSVDKGKTFSQLAEEAKQGISQ